MLVPIVLVASLSLSNYRNNWSQKVTLKIAANNFINHRKNVWTGVFHEELWHEFLYVTESCHSQLYLTGLPLSGTYLLLSDVG